MKIKPPEETTKACTHPAGTFWWVSAAGLRTAGEMGIYPDFLAPLLIMSFYPDLLVSPEIISTIGDTQLYIPLGS